MIGMLGSIVFEASSKKIMTINDMDVSENARWQKHEVNNVRSRLEFIGDEGSLFNDFYDYRTFNPIWKDNTTLSRGVEEKILFPLKEIYINELEYILENNNLNITLRSDYDERLAKRKLSEKEVFKMKEILDLYKKLQTKNEEKENGN